MKLGRFAVIYLAIMVVLMVLILLKIITKKP